MEMKKEDQIEKICQKEKKAESIKNWLITLFFVAALGALTVEVAAFCPPINDSGEHAAATVLITDSIFLLMIVSGYFYYWKLSKKQDRLWKQKQNL